MNYVHTTGDEKMEFTYLMKARDCLCLSPLSWNDVVVVSRDQETFSNKSSPHSRRCGNTRMSFSCLSEWCTLSLHLCLCVHHKCGKCKNYKGNENGFSLKIVIVIFPRWIFYLFFNVWSSLQLMNLKVFLWLKLLPWM